VNGAAIYGSTYGPLQNLSFGRTTAKGRTIYLHIFDWPSGPLAVPGLEARVSKATMLGGSTPVRFQQKGNELTLTLPGRAPDPSATVVALETR
jgi:alpha-L-fucosidase